MWKFSDFKLTCVACFSTTWMNVAKALKSFTFSNSLDIAMEFLSSHSGCLPHWFLNPPKHIFFHRIPFSDFLVHPKIKHISSMTESVACWQNRGHTPFPHELTGSLWLDVIRSSGRELNVFHNKFGSTGLTGRSNPIVTTLQLTDNKEKKTYE